jgi:hypothetical protein
MGIKSHRLGINRRAFEHFMLPVIAGPRFQTLMTGSRRGHFRYGRRAGESLSFQAISITHISGACSEHRSSVRSGLGSRKACGVSSCSSPMTFTATFKGHLFWQLLRSASRRLTGDDRP